PTPSQPNTKHSPQPTTSSPPSPSPGLRRGGRTSNAFLPTSTHTRHRATASMGRSRTWRRSPRRSRARPAARWHHRRVARSGELQRLDTRGSHEDTPPIGMIHVHGVWYTPLPYGTV